MKRKKTTTIILDSLGEILGGGEPLRSARFISLPAGMGKSHLIAETARRYGQVIFLPHDGPPVFIVHHAKAKA